MTNTAVTTELLATFPLILRVLKEKIDFYEMNNVVAKDERAAYDVISTVLAQGKQNIPALTKEGSNHDFVMDNAEGAVYVKSNQFVVRLENGKDENGFNTLSVKSFESGYEDGHPLSENLLTASGLNDYHYTEDVNGNLVLSVAEHAKDDLAELWAACIERYNCPEDGFLMEFLEEAGWSTNGHLFVAMPEWTASLTQAPMISSFDLNPALMEDGSSTAEDAKAQEEATVWFYGDYAIDCYVERLLKNGSVTFTKA